MPEITDAEYRQFVTYQQIGTPDEIRKKMNDLVKDNGGYRDQLRDLKDQVPPDGSFIVSEQDHKRLSDFSEFGTLEDLQNRLDQGKSAMAELTGLQKRSSLTGFTKAVGLVDESVDVLMALPALQDAKFEVRTKKDDNGNELPQGYITLAGEEKAVSFDKAREQFPALNGLRTVDNSSSDLSLTHMIPMGSDQKGGNKPANRYDAIREEVASRQNQTTNQVEVANTVRERLGVGART